MQAYDLSVKAVCYRLWDKAYMRLQKQATEDRIVALDFSLIRGRYL